MTILETTNQQQVEALAYELGRVYAEYLLESGEAKLLHDAIEEAARAR